jgi:hypothetical protein
MNKKNAILILFFGLLIGSLFIFYVYENLKAIRQAELDQKNRVNHIHSGQTANSTEQAVRDALNAMRAQQEAEKKADPKAYEAKMKAQEKAVTKSLDTMNAQQITEKKADPKAYEAKMKAQEKAVMDALEKMKK